MIRDLKFKNYQGKSNFQVGAWLIPLSVFALQAGSNKSLNVSFGSF